MICTKQLTKESASHLIWNIVICDQLRHAWCVFCCHFGQRTMHKYVNSEILQIVLTHMHHHRLHWDEAAYQKFMATIRYTLNVHREQMPNVCHCFVSKWRFLWSWAVARQSSLPEARIGWTLMAHLQTITVASQITDNLFNILYMLITKETAKLRWWPMDYSHKWQLMQKAFPCHEVIMI